MCRCISCNRQLEWVDFQIPKSDGTEEDMCKVCLGEVNNIKTPLPHRYMFEDLKEGVTPQKSSSYDD